MSGYVMVQVVHFSLRAIQPVSWCPLSVKKKKMRQVVYPERKNEAPFRGLVAQLKSFAVPVNMGMPGGVYGLGLIVGAVLTFVLVKPPTKVLAY